MCIHTSTVGRIIEKLGNSILERIDYTFPLYNFTGKLCVCVFLCAGLLNRKDKVRVFVLSLSFSPLASLFLSFPFAFTALQLQLDFCRLH